MPATIRAPDWALNQPAHATANVASKQPNIIRRIRRRIATTDNGRAQGFMPPFKQQIFEMPVKNCCYFSRLGRVLICRGQDWGQIRGVKV
jgi:hypothetical protein